MSARPTRIEKEAGSSAHAAADFRYNSGARDDSVAPNDALHQYGAAVPGASRNLSRAVESFGD